MKNITESNCIVHIKDKKYQIGKKYNNKTLKSIEIEKGWVVGFYDINSYTRGIIFESTIEDIFIEYNIYSPEIFIHDRERLNRFFSKINKRININILKKTFIFIKNVISCKSNDYKIIVSDGDNAKIIRFNSKDEIEYMSLEQAKSICKINNEKYKLRRES